MIKTEIMKKIVLFGALLLVLVSCRHDSPKSIGIDERIKFDVEQMSSLSQDIDTVEYLPLEFNEKGLYSNSSKVVFRNGKIFIGDFVLNKIAVYDYMGKFLYVINSRGRAANEYLEIKSFCVTEHEIAIIDNVNHHLKLYDVESGCFIENKNMPFVAWDVEWLVNDGFVFAFSSLQKDYCPNKLRYRLFFTDADLNITDKRYPFSEKEIDPIGKITYFSSTPDEIIFHWCGADYFSVIDRVDTDSVQVFGVDFGSYKVPDEYREDINKMDQGEYFYIYNTPVCSGNYFALDVMSRESSNCYLYSMADNLVKQNVEGDKWGMFYPVCTDEQGRFICLLDSYDDYKMLIEYGFPKASQKVEERMKAGGVIVLKYQMK